MLQSCLLIATFGKHMLMCAILASVFISWAELAIVIKYDWLQTCSETFLLVTLFIELYSTYVLVIRLFQQSTTCLFCSLVAIITCDKIHMLART